MFAIRLVISCLLIGFTVCNPPPPPPFEYTTIASDPVDSSDEIVQHPIKTQPQRCDDARLKCAFRLDCSQALSAYMIHCADLIAGTVPKDQCPSKCSKALIALASTEQGAQLEECDCGGSQFCRLSKERVEVCREQVEHEIADDTVVSCSTAKFICSSNTQCLTALAYYNKFCKAMFRGRHCSRRCLNSFNILQRQRAAYKLRTCVCDGTEDFPCEAIKQNTELLCLKRAANSTAGTSIELLAGEEHRPVHHLKSHHPHHHLKHHALKHHRHHKTNYLHHKFDSEQRRLKHAFYPPPQNRPLSADFESAAGQFETSPLDSEQIKKSVYFDVMMSEALSSSSLAFEPGAVWPYALAAFAGLLRIHRF